MWGGSLEGGEEIVIYVENHPHRNRKIGLLINTPYVGWEVLISGKIYVLTIYVT